jgi:hypothetical protein
MCNRGTFAVEISSHEEQFLQTWTVISTLLNNAAQQEMVNCKNWSLGEIELRLGEKRHVEMEDDIRGQGEGGVPGVWNYVIARIYTGHASRRCLVNFRVQSTSFPTQITLRFFHSISPAPPPPAPHKTFPLKLDIDFAWESFLYKDCPLVHIFSRDFNKLPSDRLLRLAPG